MPAPVFELPESDPVRSAVREWLDSHPAPSGRALAEAGLVAPHWPPPFGRGADAITQLLIDDELRRAGVVRPFNPIGLGWAGPTILSAGTATQKERWLWPMLAGEEVWCQLFSEPNAGSDLASLRTRAVRDGDEWVVEGQKIWTSLAHLADFGILLAKTDLEVPKHRGISYFVCPMRAPGVTVRPLVDMTGTHAFNEVFLEDVRLPLDHLVGGEGEGWALARVTLANERVSLSGEGTLWGRGPTAAGLVSLIASTREETGGPASSSPAQRDRLARAWIEGEVLHALRLGSVSATVAGREPGSAASVRKALADAHGQDVMNLARDLSGAYGMLAQDRTTTGDEPGGDGQAGDDPAGDEPGGNGPGGDDPTEAPAGEAPKGPSWAAREWAAGFLYSRALTIGGGTSEIQRNIVGERMLGLPKDGAGDDQEERRASK